MNDIRNINLWRLGQEITKHAAHEGITREDVEQTYRLLTEAPAMPGTYSGNSPSESLSLYYPLTQRFNPYSIRRYHWSARRNKK